MAKRKVLMTGATGYIASPMLPRFRDIYDVTLLDVKDTDPSGAKVPGAIIASSSPTRHSWGSCARSGTPSVACGPRW